MQTKSLLTGPFTGEVTIEYRAARPSEIREVDNEDPIVPAFVLLTHDEWRDAVAPFKGHGPVFDAGWGGSRRSGPPGWSLWAQLASRSGDVIVGGRDDVGFPAVPAAYPDGGIGFESVAPGATTTPLGSTLEVDRGCRPVLSREGSIVCSSSGCDDCLRAATLTSWYSMISCMCRHRTTTAVT